LDRIGKKFVQIGEFYNISFNYTDWQICTISAIDVKELIANRWEDS